jgi:hypothetical protein
MIMVDMVMGIQIKGTVDTDMVDTGMMITVAITVMVVTVGMTIIVTDTMWKYITPRGM